MATPRTSLEVADIFRSHGAAWRKANRRPFKPRPAQSNVRHRNCRTAELGGHVARCENGACGHTAICYNRCRTATARSARARRRGRGWRRARPSFCPYHTIHRVFTLPAPIADIACQNKAVVYGLLFKAAAETMLTIAADPKHLGAKTGMTRCSTLGDRAFTHHPHVHMIVPGGGVAPDGSRSSPAAARPPPAGLALSRLFRRLMLEKLRRRTTRRASCGTLAEHVSQPRHPRCVRRLPNPLRRKTSGSST